MLRAFHNLQDTARGYSLTQLLGGPAITRYHAFGASIVAKAERSKAADHKAATKRTPDGLPVHSFRSLLANLATVTRNTMAMTQSLDTPFDRAFQLLGVPVKL